MAKIRIFQKKEVIQAQQKWMMENHKYDEIFNTIMCVISGIGISQWALGNNSDFVQLVSVSPFLFMLLLMKYRHGKYDEQASAELQRI